MTKANRNPERDAVLFSFHEAFERPTAAQIIEWTERYPEFADDIRAHAAIAREWADAEGVIPAEADESLLADGYSRALDLMHKASKSTSEAHRSFQDIIAARGMTVPQVARAIGIDRGIIADLFGGRMSGPIRKVFLDPVTEVLTISRDAFARLHQNALTNPTLGLAKATHAPSIVVRSYDEIIRTCDDLTKEEKKKWLEED
jgi:transcriptional regulator with XRE-family HTH domain